MEKPAAAQNGTKKSDTADKLNGGNGQKTKNSNDDQKLDENGKPIKPPTVSYFSLYRYADKWVCCAALH